MDFWGGVLFTWDAVGRPRWRLADGRVITPAEMEQRERLFKAGHDPDGDWKSEVDNVDSVLGSIIAMERGLREMTQRDLATLAGVSQSMVARLERGVREPSWRTFRLLLEAMRLEPLVVVRDVQTTAPSSGSESDGGPGRML